MATLKRNGWVSGVMTIHFSPLVEEGRGHGNVVPLSGLSPRISSSFFPLNMMAFEQGKKVVHVSSLLFQWRAGRFDKGLIEMEMSITSHLATSLPLPSETKVRGPLGCLEDWGRGSHRGQTTPVDKQWRSCSSLWAFSHGLIPLPSSSWMPFNLKFLHPLLIHWPFPDKSMSPFPDKSLSPHRPLQ